MTQSGYRKKWLHKAVMVLNMFIILGFLAWPVLAQNDHYSILKERLIRDGFNRYWIEKVYAGEGVQFEAQSISAYFTHNEATLNYDQFTSRKNIDKARKYLKEHASDLERAQREFGVDPKAITAIILVETKLGTYLGKQSILNILSTMSALTEEAPREEIWSTLPPKRRFARDKFEQKADSKSVWAYKELKAFLQFAYKQELDPTTVMGSYAGAMGISQFMPSNILLFGQDGNYDGHVDLFVHADAIMSVASYLKNYGWRPGINREQAAKVVYHYNHSNYYVDTVLKIMELL
jgi:membrane-bound lytic murein transglycosylase B